MLLLTRRVGEEIEIGPNIRVKVVEIRGNSVRLGFETPPSVPVLRAELLQKVKLALTERRRTRVKEEAQTG